MGSLGTNKILVAAQVPPPFGGMSIMVENLLQGKYREFQLVYVPVGLSTSIEDVAKFRVYKVLRLLRVVFDIASARFRSGARVLYYCPAGNNMGSMYRDLFILCTTRWLFEKTIFHFHAGGVSNLYQRLNFVARWVFRISYFYPDVAIRTSHLAPEDGRGLKAVENRVIPNGIADHYEETARKCKKRCPTINLLYVGILSEAKGILVLIDACALLRKRGLEFRGILVGKFESATFEQKCNERIDRCLLKEEIIFPGELRGEDKFMQYAVSDILCFPSFYEDETFGLVLLEAMQFKLPVVATKWRGIPTVVQDRVNGILVDIRDPVGLADAMEELIRNKRVRKQFGEKGREIYLGNFTLDRFHRNIEECFSTLFASS